MAEERERLEDPRRCTGTRGSGLVLFMWRWASSPYRIGGIMPSAKPLAWAMACASIKARRGEGPVVELGAGTGSITRALIEQGVGRAKPGAHRTGPGDVPVAQAEVSTRSCRQG